jgi:hypothetical protein
MRRTIFIVFCSVVIIANAAAQSASATWQSPADTMTTAAVVAGNITAPSQVLSKTAIAGDTLSIRDYVGGTITSGSPVGVAERIWCNGSNWPTETVKNTGRYIQYSVSPNPGNNFTVQSITLNLGCFGTNGKMYASISCSTDSTFTTSTVIYPATVLLDIRTIPFTALAFTPGTVVNDGQTFYVRIYPWYNTTPSASKYICITNVVVSGTTVAAGAPSLTVFPPSLSFSTIKVNTTKDFSFTLSGTLLNPASDSIRITPPNGFGVSTTQGNGYASYLALPYSGATLNLDTVFVRFMPSLIQEYSGNISVSGGGITPQTIAVSGTAVDPSTILGIFVSTSGNDTNAGTYAQPYLTLQKAISVAQPGDTIFVRAGTYTNNTTIGISQSGTSGNLFCLYAYPPDNSRPVLDFSSMSFNGSNRGINLAGSYWHIKGLDIYKAGDNGMYTSGSHNIVEYCVFRENRDGGCQVGGGASYNQYINCDSYYNFDDTGDTTTAGANADGFSPKMDVGTGNYFYGCRSWQNSDDGWDGYLRPSDDVSTTIENCWSFMNGYLKDGVTAYPQMNGNGIKMGGSDSKNLKHNMLVKNCFSFLNKAKGFDQNNNLGSMTILNCTSYHNGIGTSGGAYNFSIPLAMAAGKVLTVENCLSYVYTKSPGYIFGTQTSPVFATNNWMSPFVTPTDADFISVDTTGVRGPRKSDGSLPDINFMHLASNSQFVNAGTNVGLSFIGTAPDLGCFESSVLTGVADQSKALIPNTLSLYQNYPNPFNPSTEIRYTVASVGAVKLSVYDILGQEVATLVNAQRQPGNYTVEWNAARMSSGMYFARLSVLTGKGQSFTQTRKMMFTK